MRLGISTILTPLLGTEQSIERLAQSFRKCGSDLSLVEVLCEEPQISIDKCHREEIKKLVTAYSRLGIEVSLHAPCYDVNPASTNLGARREAMRQYLACLEMAGYADISSVVVHVGSKSSGLVPNENALSASIEVLTACALKAQELGIHLLIENTGAGYGLFLPSPVDFLNLVMQIPGALALLDVGHAACMGWNLADTMTTLMNTRGTLRQLHYHDNHGKSDDHLPPGEGTLPLQEVVNALGNDWRGDLVLEVFSTDVDKAIATSVNHLASMGVGVTS